MVGLLLSAVGIGHGFEVAFEVVEARFPQFSVRPQPLVEGAQRFRANPIQAPLGIRSDFHEPRLPENAQVFGDGGLAQAERGNQVADGALVGPHEIENPAPVRFGEYLKTNIHGH
jgi:hypothetical protein